MNKNNNNTNNNNNKKKTTKKQKTKERVKSYLYCDGGDRIRGTSPMLIVKLMFS